MSDTYTDDENIAAAAHLLGMKVEEITSVERHGDHVLVTTFDGVVTRVDSDLSMSLEVAPDPDRVYSVPVVGEPEPTATPEPEYDLAPPTPDLDAITDEQLLELVAARGLSVPGAAEPTTTTEGATDPEAAAGPPSDKIEDIVAWVRGSAAPADPAEGWDTRARHALDIELAKGDKARPRLVAQLRDVLPGDTGRAV